MKFLRLSAILMSFSGLVFAMGGGQPKPAKAPLPLEPTWQVSGSQNQEFLGYAMDVCDFNGDGKDDLFLGTPFYNTSNPMVGRVQGYFGSSKGFSAKPSWESKGPKAFRARGNHVSCAGDVNGDGSEDLGVQDAYLGPAGHKSEAHIFYGSKKTKPSAKPGWSLQSKDAGTSLGALVMPIGSVNGDNITDVLISAPLASRSLDETGEVWFYLGTKEGIAEHSSGRYFGKTSKSQLGYQGVLLKNSKDSSLVAMARHGNSEDGRYAEVDFIDFAATSRPLVTDTLMLEKEYFAVNLAGGDFNGDGHQDLVVAAENASQKGKKAGRVELYFGGGKTYTLQTPQTLFGAAAGDRFGSGVAAGDVNGDGFDDLAVGSVGSNGQTGQVALYLGGEAGLADKPVWTFQGTQAKEAMGGRLLIGDVNGDGKGDLIVTATSYSEGGTDMVGRVLLFLAK